MVMREADSTEIEELLKHEPTLAYKLLRHINSVGFGSNIEITSFRHAVMTVGLKKLFRWTALLITNTPPGSVAPAAGTLAIVRGRVMELLALETMSPADADLAFVTGMFSMLDTLLGMPLEDALALVNLPKAITDAILSGDGPFAQYLAIAKACENTDEALLDILSVRNRIASAHMIDTHLQALAWAEQFGH
jgi:c-di-GMP-related signal transduction protein